MRYRVRMKCTITLKRYLGALSKPSYEFSIPKNENSRPKFRPGASSIQLIAITGNRSRKSCLHSPERRRLNTDHRWERQRADSTSRPAHRAVNRDLNR